MQRPLVLTASILSADLGHLQDEVDSIAGIVDWLQIDVMDGHFVDNLSFGAPVVRSLHTSLPLDIHLMVTNPEDRIEEFLEIGARHITFHAEAITDTPNRRGLIAAIRNAGATAGIAINPDTPVDAIDDVADDVDLLLVMSVVPGFGGQPLREDVLPKVRALRSRFPTRMIQMDGGINGKTAALCREAGADNLVVGNALFSASDRPSFIASLRG